MKRLRSFISYLFKMPNPYPADIFDEGYDVVYPYRPPNPYSTDIFDDDEEE